MVINLLKDRDKILYRNNGFEKKVNEINLLASSILIFLELIISLIMQAELGVPLKTERRKAIEELPLVLNNLLNNGLINLLILSKTFKLIIKSFMINIINNDVELWRH